MGAVLFWGPNRDANLGNYPNVGLQASVSFLRLGVVSYRVFCVFCRVYMGGCQNYGPFLEALENPSPKP